MGQGLTYPELREASLRKQLAAWDQKPGGDCPVKTGRPPRWRGSDGVVAFFGRTVNHELVSGRILLMWCDSGEV